MGVIADLFSCGRSRRTRELSTEPHLTNDATPQLHVPGLELEQVAHETTATGDKTTTDTANDIRVPTIAPVPSPVQQSVHHWDGGRSRSRDSNTLDFSVHHEKGKLSAGWMVEQKFLVTTTSSRNSTPAPEPEKEETASTLVRCPTPEEEPWNATVRAATPEPQVETSDASMLVRCATPEEEPWNATVRHATPEPEAVSIRCATPEPEVIQVSRTATPEPEPQQITLPVEEVAPVSVVEEVRSATPEPVVEIVEVADEVEDVQVTKKTAPASLLDLPPEVRNRIYESMNEDVPIRMCRHDDPALAPRDGETAPAPKRQFYGLTQACRQLRSEFLPIYAKKAHYIIDLWSQKANLVNIDALQGQVSMDIDAACFDMEPIDLLPLIRTLVRKNRTDCQFTSTEGVVFRSIAEIVLELNKLLPKTDGSTKSWLSAVNGPMKRIDLHLFPHDDIRQYYRFRGAEPLLRVVYPSAVAEDWMKRSSKSEGYEAYMQATGLDKFEMHVVVGHASRRTTNEGRLPLDWRMSYQVSRMSRDCSPRRSMDVAAARMSIDRAPRMSSSLAR